MPVVNDFVLIFSLSLLVFSFAFFLAFYNLPLTKAAKSLSKKQKRSLSIFGIVLIIIAIIFIPAILIFLILNYSNLSKSHQATNFIIWIMLILTGLLQGTVHIFARKINSEEINGDVGKFAIRSKIVGVVSYLCAVASVVIWILGM